MRKEVIIERGLQAVLIAVLSLGVVYYVLGDRVQRIAPKPNTAVGPSQQPPTIIPPIPPADYELGVTEVSVTTTNTYDEGHRDSKGRPCTKAIINGIGQQDGKENCYPKCNFNSECATACQAPAPIGMCLRGIGVITNEKEKKGICICSKEHKK